jgi:hypothetical protein
MRFVVLCAMSAILLLGCGAPPAPQTSNPSGGGPPPPPGANVVTISDTAAIFAGTAVPFPATRAQLVAALGEPSRTVDKANKIFVWDQKGIYAYSKTDRDFINDISFSFAKEEWDYAPQSTFSGSIQIGNLTITKDTTEAALVAGGFKKERFSFEKSLGTNVVLVEHEGGVKSLSHSVP